MTAGQYDGMPALPTQNLLDNNFDATGPVPADNMLTITICHTIGRRLDDVGKKTIRSDNIGPLPGG